MKQDIALLQNQFKRGYFRSEAEHMSGMRDLPPIGKIIWAKQIGKWRCTLGVEACWVRIGKAHGRSRAKVNVRFVSAKLDGPIFDEWIANAKDRNFEVTGRIFP